MSLSVLEPQSRLSVFDNEEYIDDVEVIFDLSKKYITRQIGNSFKYTPKSERDLVNIARRLKKCADLKKDFLEAFDAWEPSRKKSINYVDEAITKLDKIHFETNIARAAASTGGVISGCIGIIASVVMLLNKDASSWKLAADVGNLASSVVSNAAEATELGLIKTYLGKAKQIFRSDSESFEPIQEWFECSEDLKEAIEEVCNCDIISDVIQKLMIVVPLVARTYLPLESQVHEVVTQVVHMLQKNITLNDIEKIVLLCTSVCRNPELLKNLRTIYHIVKDSPSIMPVVTMLVKVPCELKFLTHLMTGSTGTNRKKSRSEAITYGLSQGVNVAIEIFSAKHLVEDFQRGSKSGQSAVLEKVKQQLEKELMLVSEVRQMLD